MQKQENLKAAQVATELGITVSAVHRLATRTKADGTITLPSEWIGGIRIWPRARIDDYKKDQAAQDRRRAMQARLRDSKPTRTPKTSSAAHTGGK